MHTLHAHSIPLQFLIHSEPSELRTLEKKYYRVSLRTVSTFA